VVKLRHHNPVPAADADQVRKFFRQPYIVIRELDRFLAEEAQSMVWDHGVDPKDAVHVATALRVGVEQLDTFDEKLIGKSAGIGNPPLIIGRPLVTEQLELPEPGSAGAADRPERQPRPAEASSSPSAREADGRQ
jgi:hypothetical protein